LLYLKLDEIALLLFAFFNPLFKVIQKFKINKKKSVVGKKSVRLHVSQMVEPS